MLEASMIVVGDEILGGYVADQNSPWLAERLRVHGVPLSRVHVVPDELDAIGEAVRAELARSRPRLILTSGGVGSTPDDITYEAVAACLGQDVVEHATIAERIDGVLRWTRDLGLEVTDEFAWHFLRMARIPAEGRLLLRDRGWVAGVAVDVDGGIEAGSGATVVVLPGVPSEFRSLLTEVVEPDLLAGRNDPPRVVEIEHGFPESALNLALVDVLERFPEVRLGSYPGTPMLIRLTGPAEQVEPAAVALRGAIADLEASPGGARLAEAWVRRSRAAGDTEEGS